MNPFDLNKLIDLLTLDRALIYAALTMLLFGSSILAGYFSEPGKLITRTDFPCFYIAGSILNEGGPLYNAKLQESKYHDLERPFPPDPQSVRYFAYTPFFAVIFRPLALLPFSAAFVCWAAIGSTSYLVGFWFLWSAARLPTQFRFGAGLIAFSWFPVFAWTILFGQTSMFGFFVFSLCAFFLSRSKSFAAGIAISFLLYKPPLLVLILPMLVLTSNWRTLCGFFVGSFILGLVSLWIVGSAGVGSYIEMLKLFSALKVNGGRPTLLEIDIYSFFFSLFRSRRVAIVAFVLFAAVVLPFLISLWRLRPTVGLEVALIWTLVLNFYVLMYDSTLVIVPIIMAAGRALTPFGLPRFYRWILLLLFVVPWFEQHVVASTGFQLITPVIVALGFYQLSSARHRRLIETS